MIMRFNWRSMGRSPGKSRTATFPAALLLLALFLVTPTASARITKSRSSVSSAARQGLGTDVWWSPLYSTVIGAGIEYSSDADFTEYAFPILVEYQISNTLLIAFEPEYLSLVSKDPEEPSLKGWGDFETTLNWEFLRERRFRPALSLEAKIKWPTAEHADLGEPGLDYTLGLIATKELGRFEVDLNVLYTFSGHSERQDSVEAAFAVAYHLNPWIHLIGEVTTVARVGGARGDGTAARFESEALVGLAWLVSKNLTIEHGITFKKHGEWQAVLAFEWSFSGD